MQLRRQREHLEVDRQMAIDCHHQMLLQRRDDNIESLLHLDILRHDQEMLTRPWVFSYYIVWPRESYRIYARYQGQIKDSGRRGEGGGVGRCRTIPCHE